MINWNTHTHTQMRPNHPHIRSARRYINSLSYSYTLSFVLFFHSRFVAGYFFLVILTSFVYRRAIPSVLWIYLNKFSLFSRIEMCLFYGCSFFIASQFIQFCLGSAFSSHSSHFVRMCISSITF